VVDAGDFIVGVTADTTVDQYIADRQLRRVTERSCEIIGESLRRLERTDPATANRITSYRFAIDFRNRLVHGYDEIDHRQVWLAIQESLPALLQQAQVLLNEAERATQMEGEE
jgi:uncharacterized protein with HEPN domain